MPATINITNENITTVLGDFLASIVLSGTSIILGQQNLVAEPATADFVVMWPLSRNRLAYNQDTFAFVTAPTTTQSENDTRVTFQLDVHGPQSNDNASIIATMWNDDYAAAFFRTEGYPIGPLYMSDPQQMPFLNGEAQYEDRWVMRAEMQANIVISTSQQFADTLRVGLIDVDVVYPP